MEPTYEFQQNGQELRQQDVESISENAGLADDRVLWEILRLLPGSSTPQKAILPYAVSGEAPTTIGAADSTALIRGETSDATVHVMPFRAILGSTTLEATSVVEALRGVRSAYLVGTSTLHRDVSISANVAGNPRWTLIYATVTPDAANETATVLRKDPTSGVVSSIVGAVINRTTVVTISALDGTAAASPSRPALPSDGAGNYYLAIAYVWIPDGFGASTAVAREHIHEVAPVVSISPALGVASIGPANQQFEPGGTTDVRQSGPSSATRPGTYLPPTMVGGAVRYILLSLNRTPLCPVDGDVVDDSIDWRYRFFTWTVHIEPGADGFASDRGASLTGGQTPTAPNTLSSASFGYKVTTGMGQSFYDDTGFGNVFVPATADSGGTALYVSGVDVTAMNLGAPDPQNIVALYVRDTDGALVFRRKGTLPGNMIVRLEATGAYSNFGNYA